LERTPSLGKEPPVLGRGLLYFNEKAGRPKTARNYFLLFLEPEPAS
jgi:hypothetical protein